jgi:hypothetical protein
MVKELNAVFDKDTHKKHRYVVISDGVVSGTLYILKSMPVPKKLTFNLMNQQEYQTLTVDTELDDLITGEDK